MIWPREKICNPADEDQSLADSSKVRGRAVSNRNRVYDRLVLCQRAQALIFQLAELEILRGRVQEAEENTLLCRAAAPVRSTIH